MYTGTIINNFLIISIFGHRYILKYSFFPYLFHEGAFCFAMEIWFGGGSELCDVIFREGVLLFVTKCDEGGRGRVKYRPKLRDVIYGRPPGRSGGISHQSI